MMQMEEVSTTFKKGKVGLLMHGSKVKLRMISKKIRNKWLRQVKSLLGQNKIKRRWRTLLIKTRLQMMILSRIMGSIMNQRATNGVGPKKFKRKRLK